MRRILVLLRQALPAPMSFAGESMIASSAVEGEAPLKGRAVRGRPKLSGATALDDVVVPTGSKKKHELVVMVLVLDV